MFFKKITICILFCISLPLIFSGCTMSENTIISECESPDGRYKAIVFTRDAGATTTKSYNLSILASGEKLSTPVGNAFHSDSDFGIEWLENQKLLVKINDSSKRIIKQLESVNDVIITYEDVT